MSCGTCAHHTHPHRSLHGIKTLLITIYLIVVGLSIYLHIGLGWSPWALVPALVVLAHAVIFGVIGVVTARLASGGDGASRGSHSHTHAIALIQRPRLYDLFVRVMSLGREGAFRRRVLSLVRLRPGHALLDVGCGTGTQLLLAAPIVGGSGTLCGVEPSGPMVAHAMVKARARGVNLRVSQGSADCIPFADASFDAVVCTMVMHHLPEADRAAAIAEMHRVLRSGGRVVVADVQRPRALSALFSAVSLAHLRAPHPLMDMAEVGGLLERAGFVGIEHQPRGGAIGVVVAVRA